jgi:hypothetical protein
VLSSRSRALRVVAIVAISTPLAVALESLLRQWMFPPEFEDVRAWLEPSITPWMWLTPLACALGIPIGLRLHRWLVRRTIARMPVERRTPVAEANAVTDALLLSTSVPQVPAIVATMGLLLGSALTPVLVATATATVGVLVIGIVASRELPASVA